MYARQQNLIFNILRPLTKNKESICSNRICSHSESNCSYFYLLMINGFMCYVLVEIESILKYKHELTVYYPSSF